MWGRPPGFCNILCLPSATYFSLPGTPSHQGLFLHPGANQPTEQLTWAPFLHYLVSCLQGLVGASSPPHQVLKFFFNLHIRTFSSKQPHCCPRSPEPLSPGCLSPGSGHLLCLPIQHPFCSFFWWQHCLSSGELPLFHSLRLDGASNHIIPFILTTTIGPGTDMWPKPGQSESLPGILYMEHRKKNFSLSFGFATLAWCKPG